MTLTPFTRFLALAFLIAAATWLPGDVWAAGGSVIQDASHKTTTLADGNHDLVLRLRCDGGCVLDQVVVRGRPVIAPAGVYSGIKVGARWYTTQACQGSPAVILGKDTLTVNGITFGGDGVRVRERWTFRAGQDRITWRIERTLDAGVTLEDTAMPAWDFAGMDTWKGGLLADGGVAWGKYLETMNATYGVRSGGVTFWKPESRDCLRITPLHITPTASRAYIGQKFTHQPDGTFSYRAVVSSETLKPRLNLARYRPDSPDLWAPLAAPAGDTSVEYTLQALDYDDAYSRGDLPGVDGAAVRELLNTVGRYGVVDDALVGGNGWRTGWVCLHEPFFGLLGLAIDDPGYTANLAASLDQERDQAMQSDGRVLSRWHQDGGDAMPGTYRPSGYYECAWGYTLDSQPDYVLCVCDEFDLTGDLPWLRGQKAACERALDYLLRRDTRGTGLAEMMTGSAAEGQCSDWLDTIYASGKNALVNALLYGALTEWSQREELLGDAPAAVRYRAAGVRLKAAFNRSTADGGFWDPARGWYAYWRETDGSVHGDNLVLPVNFCAIAYGLCGDPARRRSILQKTEAQMQRENLFHWPLCVYPFEEKAPADPCLSAAKWIWHPAATDTAQTCWLRRSFEVPAGRHAVAAPLKVSADDRYVLLLDGRPVGSGDDWHRVGRYDVAAALTPGRHILAVEAKNDSGPSGLLLGLRVTLDDGTVLPVVSDGSWRASLRKETGWDVAGFRDDAWASAQEIAAADGGPWNLVPTHRRLGADNSFPFPSYENGDIFLSWGEMGVRAYAQEDPATAMKYVRAVLARYGRDGLSFQRYGRRDQAGMGDDILAGNAMTIAGLYRDIYGVRPKWNRLYLEPHLTPDLNGTRLRYALRGQEYQIALGASGARVSVGGFSARDAVPFAVAVSVDTLRFYPGDGPLAALTVTRSADAPVDVAVEAWPDAKAGARRWSESCARARVTAAHSLGGLRPGSAYTLTVNGAVRTRLRADPSGHVSFRITLTASPQRLTVAPAGN